MAYPNTITSWVPRVDITDVVYAGDINSVYTEITGLETALGLNLLTSTWTGSFTQGASWASLSARLINIERGVVDATSNIHPQYLRIDGTNSMSAALVMSTNKITGLGNGTTSTDAATYGQVVLRDGTNNLTGNLPANSNKITGLAAGTTAGDSVRYEQVLLRDGTNNLTANLAANNNKITGLAAGTSNGDSVRYEEYAAVKTTADNALQRSGGTMTGNIAMGGFTISGLAQGLNSNDAVTVNQLYGLAGPTKADVRRALSYNASSNYSPTGGSLSNGRLTNMTRTPGGSPTLNTGDRILLIGPGPWAGIWVITAQGDSGSNGVWDRASDFNSDAHAQAGAIVYSTEDITVYSLNADASAVMGGTNGTSFKFNVSRYLPVTGGTMTGPIAMTSSKITGLAAGSTAGDAVRYEQAVLRDGTNAMTGALTLPGAPTNTNHAATKGYVDAVGTYQNWTPTFEDSGITLIKNWTGTGRYQQTGKHVTGWGKITAGSSASTGTGTYRVALPVAPRQSTEYPRIGHGMIWNGNQWFAYFQMELQYNQNYVQLMITGLSFEDHGADLYNLSINDQNHYGWQSLKWVDSTFMTTQLLGSNIVAGACISFQFDYEAA